MTRSATGPALVLLGLLTVLVGCRVTGAPTAVPRTSGASSPESAESAPETGGTGPSSGVDASVVTRIVTLTTPDGRRSAIIHHPRTARAGAGLVVVLHPAATTAQDAEDAFGWDALADRAGFVVAYPEGTLSGFQDTWNAGRCCAPASELGTDDVGFLHTLAQDLRRTDALGPDVVAVGFSNGGMLAYAWACLRPGDLTGIGVVAGAVTVDCDSPGRLTVVAVHGRADPLVPLAGGSGPAAVGLVFPSVAQSLAPFERAAGCPTTATSVRTAGAQVQTWTCPEHTQIALAVLDGVGHAYPGAGPGAGTGSAPTDATGFLWSRLRTSLP